jgi:lipoate-protein ligase A
MPRNRTAEWRFIGIKTNDATSNMAIDEAIVLARSQDRVPNTVRLYKWKPPAVSIGYFLKINEVADLQACKKLGIDVVRRISGGGAVYHSENEVTYSAIVNQDDPVVSQDVIELYKKLSGAIASVPRKLGLEASFEPGHPGVCPNMIVAGKKISGNAQARKKGVILQHGTLLLDCDLDVMSKVLRMPFSLIADKVTTIKRELQKSSFQGGEITASVTLVEDTLRAGFEESLGVKLVDGDITKLESHQADRLRMKYASVDWTKMR